MLVNCSSKPQSNIPIESRWFRAVKIRESLLLKLWKRWNLQVLLKVQNLTFFQGRPVSEWFVKFGIVERRLRGNLGTELWVLVHQYDGDRSRWAHLRELKTFNLKWNQKNDQKFQVALNPAYQLPELDFCLKKVDVKAIIAPETFRKQKHYEMLATLMPSLQHSRNGRIEGNDKNSLRNIIIHSDKKLP